MRFISESKVKSEDSDDYSSQSDDDEQSVNFDLESSKFMRTLDLSSLDKSLDFL